MSEQVPTTGIQANDWRVKAVGFSTVAGLIGYQAGKMVGAVGEIHWRPEETNTLNTLEGQIVSQTWEIERSHTEIDRAQLHGEPVDSTAVGTLATATEAREATTLQIEPLRDAHDTYMHESGAVGALTSIALYGTCAVAGYLKQRQSAKSAPSEEPL